MTKQELNTTFHELMQEVNDHLYGNGSQTEIKSWRIDYEEIEDLGVLKAATGLALQHKVLIGVLAGAVMSTIVVACYFQRRKLLRMRTEGNKYDVRHA